jgi:hypothetical protein
MNTFRSMAAGAAAGIAILTLAGCGGGSGTPAAATSAPPSTIVSDMPSQSLSDWLPTSAVIMRDLSGDLSGISSTLATDPASITADPNVAKLSADAAKGVDLTAPNGHPELDGAWDAVMQDCLLVSGDLASGDIERAATDLDRTNSDMDALKTASADL